jgi:hypothetical protein
VFKAYSLQCRVQGLGSGATAAFEVLRCVSLGVGFGDQGVGFKGKRQELRIHGLGFRIKGFRVGRCCGVAPNNGSSLPFTNLKCRV